MILVVDSDEIFGRGLIRILKKFGVSQQMSGNALSAMDIINTGELPEVIFLEIFLTGPDGFTLLNELASYPDTMKIPVVVVSDRDFSGFDLSDYNVVATLNKETMRPEDVQAILNEVRVRRDG